MEQGPTRVSRRESRPLRMSEISLRALKMAAEAPSETGRSSSRNTGGRTTFVHWMRRSSVVWNIGFPCYESISRGRDEVRRWWGTGVGVKYVNPGATCKIQRGVQAVSGFARGIEIGRAS